MLVFQLKELFIACGCERGARLLLVRLFCIWYFCETRKNKNFRLEAKNIMRAASMIRCTLRINLFPQTSTESLYHETNGLSRIAATRARMRCAYN